MRKLLIAVLFTSLSAFSQESPKEEDFYKIITPPVPEGILLEVGGLCTLPNGALAIATRRGDVFLIDNPTARVPVFKKFASGLHEILGLTYENGSLICAQRGELTKLTDTNGDSQADEYETLHAWDVSGHYHEYSFGPKIADDGSYFVSGNVAFGDQEWWRGESRTKTRGTIFKIHKDGSYEPWAAGMRSPAGLGYIDGKLFYSDNQGDWMGSGGIWHIEKGSFVGHPASLKWSGTEIKITESEFYKERDIKQVKNAQGNFIKPENEEKDKVQTLADLKTKYPAVQTPAVWLPHGILGISNSEIIADKSNGKFGPFNGQILIGDQGQSKIMRVFLEEINGKLQGAAWDFRAGFQSGVMRLSQTKDGSIFIGETNRGWGSAGDANQGLQRLAWNGKMPFEMVSCEAQSDGFLIKFTLPIDKNSASLLKSYTVKSFIYKHHAAYGSPPVENQTLKLNSVEIAEDGLSIKLKINGLRANFIHELDLGGIRSASQSWSLLHTKVFYTLNSIPGSTKTLDNSKVFNFNSPGKTTVLPEKPKTTSIVNAKPLLQKHTCLACHAEDKKVVGPSFKEIAKRNYTPERIVALIYKPEPSNWPTYATPMAAMPQVPKADALLIAKYINALK